MNTRDVIVVVQKGDHSLGYYNPEDGTQRVVPLPEKLISVRFHEGSRTALLSTHAHRMCLVDTVAGRLARVIPTRSGPDPMVVLSLPA